MGSERDNYETLLNLKIPFSQPPFSFLFAIHTDALNLPPLYQPFKGSHLDNWPRYVETTLPVASHTPTYYALDCEMVQMDDLSKQVGRVSLVNALGEVVIDLIVRPDGYVKDSLYRWSGLTKADVLKSPYRLKDVQREMLSIVKASDFIIGHSVHYDLHALQLKHPLVVDTAAVYFELGRNGNPPALRYLSKDLLNKTIQQGSHSSVEDAKITLELMKLKF
ncbi:Small RNA degrading nuclease [Wickerhamomyces ciferrii]|uniref:Small RNA degrading nuclease n=1 Tax=Wickerhamomyces ciferrii (strain ATCC 14091 / BCRC 22168 / CBS 111 / JCM 3599 / NBRC 0793 / NRRL Y-1031 F-60-10) TaxID=1206466 RepID=K0KU74_WICCF|nr:Small RNA degrading nuclease [Wickerhamomyces ciferrii]CCH44974.1 Small RNA degrading nuclease [Wickerhamomyces ciferrii]